MSSEQVAIANQIPNAAVNQVISGQEVIYVRTLTGKNIDIPYDGKMTIKELKQKLQDKEGIPADQQRLVYQGKQLEETVQGFDEERTLKDYGIDANATVHLILRLRGGF